jgi:2-C-methyl-D-erythritol 4-phosphate cytidylyltransferase
MKKYAIIVAGGSGSRMGSDLSKQFLPIHGKPILVHTIEKFLSYSSDIQLVIVLPKKDFLIWEQIISTPTTHSLIQLLNHSIIITEGGATRFLSVKNGLAKIQDNEGLVAVHDAVRPCLNLGIIQKGFEVAAEFGTAVTCVPLKDSARMVVENGENVAIDRSLYRLVQTPQTFKVSLMKAAFEQAEQTFFTDCASVIEYAGNKITLIEGSYENIKITTPEDLILAESFLCG